MVNEDIGGVGVQHYAKTWIRPLNLAVMTLTCKVLSRKP